MKSSTALLQLSLASCCALFSSAALAQSDNYPYFGLSVGQSRGDLDAADISRRVLAPGTSLTGTGSDERDTAYKAFAGYQFNRYLGAELGFFDLGRYSLQSTTLPAGTLEGSLRFRGANLDLVGTLPITERFAAIGRVGALYTRTRDHFSASGTANVVNTTPSKRDTTLKLGVGLQYALTPSLLVRAEGERYRVHNAVSGRNNVDVYTVSVVIPFGRAAASTPRTAAVLTREVASPIVTSSVAPSPMTEFAAK